MAARIDLHVHTGRYSQCAELVDPFRIPEHAVRAGLAGVVLTEHDIFWQDEEIELLRQASPLVRIYRGIEVSAAGCHILVIGIQDAGPFDRGMPPADVIREAHRSGAVAALAHPFRDSDPASLPVDLFDAIEVGSTSFTRDESRSSIRLARQLRKVQVAASDAHSLSRIGWGWTEFDQLPRDERELAEAIRRGAGRAMVPKHLRTAKGTDR